MASFMSTLNTLYTNAMGAAYDFAGIVGQKTLATLIGVTPGELEDILATANEQPSLCFVPIQAESMYKRRQVDVSNTMLISQTTQEKTYVTDNSAPHPREWTIKGYIKALLPLMESGLLIKPTLSVQETILDTASESRQTVKLKTDTGEIVDVLIKSLAIGSTPKGTNVRTIDVTVQEVTVLENSIANAFNIDAVGSASIPAQVMKNLGKNLAMAGGLAMTATSLIGVVIETDFVPAAPTPEQTKPSDEIETVAKPTTIEARDLQLNDKIYIECATEGATIIYTTDGSEPVEGGTKYEEPLIAKEPFTLKARAFKSGMYDSEVLFAKFTISGVSEVPKLPAVTSNVPSGDVVIGTIVHLAVGEPGAVILYTTDGKNPDYDSHVYTNPFIIQKTMSIKAMAVKSGFINSDVLNLDLNVSSVPTAPSVSNVTVTPSAGAVLIGTKVKLATVTSGAKIIYTTDGSVPSIGSGTIYDGSDITITNDVTIKAVAVKSGLTDSTVGIFEFTIAKVENVASSNPSGSVPSGTTILLSCSTEGATIKYTTDGSEPSRTNGNTFDYGTIGIVSNTTIKAMAYKDSMKDSDVTTYEYTVATE